MPSNSNTSRRRTGLTVRARDYLEYLAENGEWASAVVSRVPDQPPPQPIPDPFADLLDNHTYFKKKDGDNDYMRKTLFDRKTLRNLKIEVVPLTNATRKNFKTLIALKALRDTLNNKDRINEINKEIKQLRGIINNRMCKKTYTIYKKNGVGKLASTYCLLKPDGYSENFGRIIKAHSWAKQRLYELMQSNRQQARNINSEYRHFNGYEYWLTGGVHTNKGDISRMVGVHRIYALRDSKSPDKYNDYVGVEIEFLVPCSNSKLEKMLAAAGLHNNVNLKDDGSVYMIDDDGDTYDDDDWLPREINILAKETEILDVIDRTCKVLNNAGAITNRTCGLHVHIDCRNRNHKRVYKRLFHLQQHLSKIVDSDRLENTYCRLNKSDDWDDQPRDERYLAINGRDAYRKFGTIEIRLHEGTTNATAIKNWVTLLLKSANFRSVQDFVDYSRDFKELSKVIRLDKDVYEFYKGKVS